MNQKVWRCSNRVEHGKKYCNKSITIKEEELQQSICKAISQTIECQAEVIVIMMSNLESVITGKNANTDIYAIQHQISELNRLREVTINTRMNTNGDKSKYNIEIINLTKQIEHLREQLVVKKEKVTMNESLNMEVKRIKSILNNYKNQILQYDELMVRSLVERIRVMSDKTLLLILKGGIEIEQKI